MPESSRNPKETSLKSAPSYRLPDQTGMPGQQAASVLREARVSPVGIGTGPLRPLRRLRQLAEEIQSALAREDMSVVRQASSLLAPTLAQWAERRSEIPAQNAEMINLSRETQVALTDCEEAMRDAMERNRARASEIRQHRSRLRRLKAHHYQPVRSRILRDG